MTLLSSSRVLLFSLLGAWIHAFSLSLFPSLVSLCVSINASFIISRAGLLVYFLFSLSLLSSTKREENDSYKQHTRQPSRDTASGKLFSHSRHPRLLSSNNSSCSSLVCVLFLDFFLCLLVVLSLYFPIQMNSHSYILSSLMHCIHAQLSSRLPLWLCDGRVWNILPRSHLLHWCNGNDWPSVWFEANEWPYDQLDTQQYTGKEGTKQETGLG